MAVVFYPQYFIGWVKKAKKISACYFSGALEKINHFRYRVDKITRPKKSLFILGRALVIIKQQQ